MAVVRIYKTQDMLTYSVAIRTSGTGGEKYRKELLSIMQQTVQPERVVVYIAEGYDRPGFTVGKEEYVWVKKGMMAQRILPYNEISSDCILMLDDDVYLANDSAERMLLAMEREKADCVGADIYKNQDMSCKYKIYAALMNLVFPHYSKKWAFKIHRNGSSSYNNHPTKSFYWSQSCAGGASMWRKEVYHQLYLEDEMWLDEMRLAYCDDMLEFYKLYKNGYRLGILYDLGIEHLDGGSSREAYRKSEEWIYIRSKATFIIWWRSCFRPGDTGAYEQIFTAFCFLIKTIWVFLVICLEACVKGKLKMIQYHIKGIRDGWDFTHSKKYRKIRSYVISEEKYV